MKKLITSAIANPLFSSSLIMIIGTNSTNAINYVYHLLMGRLLGPVGYGELSAFFSLIGLLSVVPFSFGTVVIKFVAASKNNQQVAGYLKWFTKPVFFISLMLAGGIFLFANSLAAYLNTSHISGIMIIAVSFLFGLPSYLYRSVLQGLIRFHLVVISLISETGVKLLAGLLFVLLGYGVIGAMAGLLLAIIAGWGISFWFLKGYRQSSVPDKINTKQIFSFTLPVLIQTIATTSLMSIDLILVKHYFSGFDAGIYAAISTLGKIILFASAPVSVVMFPLVTRRFSQGEKYFSMFVLSMIVTGLVVSSVILLYFLFPQLVLSLLYGEKYFAGIPMLVPYAFFTGLLALNGLYINFFLSVNRNWSVLLPLIAAILQIIGIVVFHETIQSVIWVSISVATLLFIALSVYFLSTGIWYANRIIKN